MRDTPSHVALRTSRRGRAAGVGPGVAVFLSLVVFVVAGCGRDDSRQVVVYAAQDRVFAEPIFAEFTRATGIEVRPVYDNEATKTTGLANRLLAERPRPLADLWWSNEEMRTRQLVGLGALEPDLVRFGERQRVLVGTSNRLATLPAPPSFAALTNPAFRGRIAIAFPLFGTTAAHLLVLRQRWGDAAWQDWCRALHANRPLLVDGNSVVVRLVAAGDAWLGLTDTDDVAAAQREGSPVAAVPLEDAFALQIPNTLAVVQGAPHPDHARRLAEFLNGAGARDQLVRAGAFVAEPATARGSEIVWDRLIDELDPALRFLEREFSR